MSPIEPVVRYMVVCEDVEASGAPPQRVMLASLITTIRSLADPAFPVRHLEFCVYLQVSGCRGPARGRIQVQEADNAGVVFLGQTRTIPFSTNPLEVVGFTFRVRGCHFPRSGLYWVQFWYDDTMLVQQPLLLR